MVYDYLLRFGEWNANHCAISFSNSSFSRCVCVSRSLCSFQFIYSDPFQQSTEIKCKLLGISEFSTVPHKSTHRSDFQNSLTQHHPNDLLYTFRVRVCVCGCLWLWYRSTAYRLQWWWRWISFPLASVELRSTMTSIEIVNVDGFYTIRWCRIIHKYTHANTFICVART